MPTPISRVMTNGEEGLEGGAGGTARPYKMKAIHLHIALHSGRMNRLNQLSWSSTWGPHWSWGQMLTVSLESQLMSPGRMKKVIFPWNPWQRNMKGG